ncbi:MAG: hypothetical protein AAGM67_04610 [Bacteroidota bacterium]
MLESEHNIGFAHSPDKLFRWYPAMIRPKDSFAPSDVIGPHLVVTSDELQTLVVVYRAIDAVYLPMGIISEKTAFVQLGTGFDCI